ncbi:MAG: deoxyribodipyrimidine photo-lyase [candidate division KSB1 bacterium]|nr:deoxyribodipyrimidine photo-lyase [candidate division KSB1 bacterium]MDZ7368888.1 deoxyribodipyrimidine photo-lyase [candidate division KSB1 bacterium]MDZ7406876.1 deoxyribodipyrimidine photo-lyase [candidate division KSB1 bacterium]
MSTKLNLSVLRKRQAPMAPADRQDDFDPMQKRLVTLRHEMPRANARYVLYWMQIHRRAYQNQALNFALAQANKLDLPLVVYEGLRPDYDQANDRIHQFIIEGAIDNHRDFAKRGIRYCFYLMPDPQKGNRRAVAQLAQEAALLVTDDFPTFVVPRHNRAIVKQVDCPVYAVDANGVVPIRELEQEEYAARTIRPKLHRLLPAYLWPIEEIKPKIKSSDLKLNLREETSLERADLATLLRSANIDHSVRPSQLYHGGRNEALKRLDTFVAERLWNYNKGRNITGEHWTSELSPYLHFGHLSAMEAALAVLQAEAPAECIDAFLEELIVRRELSYNFCHFNPQHAALEALPAWARQTLFAHGKDQRPHLYSPEQLEAAETHDEIWNLAQRELLATGKIHNYVRMLWGKKIIEWSRTPQEALETMIRLHHRYALDGRNPNTYTGILWCFGKHDRAWGPQRRVFGLVRYMSSDNTRRKINLPAYKAWVESCEKQI